jgi:hypothetical protein
VNAVARMHALLAVAWLLLTVPALIWWRDSVAFVVAASLYANVVGHWGAFEAARETPT